jgi:ketosteroid isomerase-like protein
MAFLSAQAQTADENQRRTSKTEALILRLENEGRTATLNNDLAANDRLLADNWININPDGSVTTKAQLLKLLTAGSFKIMSIENDEVLIRIFGDAAVVTGRSTTKRAAVDGEIISRQVRFTRVYARNRGRWQVVSAHNTLIRDP